MASPFQQQSIRRKVIYFGLIVALFVATLAIRRMPVYGIESQAQRLELREEDLGEVELTGSALRLTLTGSRGLAVCYLWMVAEQKKMKHEWNELELVVRSVMKLQPHFMTPWKFQSWNLAYNVSVELDRVKDKYFYITRGIQLLAEGIKQNREDPDLRFAAGTYTQNKFGISDENNTLRSLFQLSCIDPVERNPDRFRQIAGGRSVVDLDRFEDFCRHHPFLVRRLRLNLRCKAPEDVIEFLAANQKIPSRYEDRPNLVGGFEQPVTPLKPVDERFPVLPPHSRFDPNEISFDNTDLADDFDNYAAARAWYSYAQDPIAEHPPHMTQLIFQGYPARAQAFVAERREQEGWFDTEGWEINDWFYKDNARPNGPRKPVTVGEGHNWAADAWERAYQLYLDFGTLAEMIKTPQEVKAMSLDEIKEYGYRRMLTNFAHHFQKCAVEKTPDAILARKYFYQANRLRRSGERARALQLYENPAAFGPAATWPREKATGWKRILFNHPEYRKDLEVQEDTFTNQQRYLQIVTDLRVPIWKQLLVVQDCLGQTARGPAGCCPFVPVNAFPAIKVPVQGPFDDTDADGVPLLSWEAKNNVRSRLGMPPDPNTPKAAPLKYGR